MADQEFSLTETAMTALTVAEINAMR